MIFAIVESNMDVKMICPICESTFKTRSGLQLNAGEGGDKLTPICGACGQKHAAMLQKMADLCFAALEYKSVGERDDQAE